MNYVILLSRQVLRAQATPSFCELCHLTLPAGVESAGHTVMNEMFFDTIRVKTKNGAEPVKERALKKEINLRYHEDGTVRIVFPLLMPLYGVNPVSLHHCINPASLCRSRVILLTILHYVNTIRGFAKLKKSKINLDRTHPTHPPAIQTFLLETHH